MCRSIHIHQGIFNVCDDVSSDADVSTLRAFLVSSLYTAAMYDYPYAFATLPAKPTKAVCGKYDLSRGASQDSRSLLESLAAAVAVINTPSESGCFDVLGAAQVQDNVRNHDVVYPRRSDLRSLHF